MNMRLGYKALPLFAEVDTSLAGHGVNGTQMGGWPVMKIYMACPGLQPPQLDLFQPPQLDLFQPPQLDLFTLPHLLFRGSGFPSGKHSPHHTHGGDCEW